MLTKIRSTEYLSLKQSRKGNLELEDKPKAIVVKIDKKSPSKQNKFKTVASQLFNMEAQLEPEKKLNIDLKLYQMENFS